MADQPKPNPKPATNIPEPGSLPKLPHTIFNLEKRGGDTTGGKRRAAPPRPPLSSRLAPGIRRARSLMLCGRRARHGGKQDGPHPPVLTALGASAA
jgi:hypothetical protein